MVCWFSQVPGTSAPRHPNKVGFDHQGGRPQRLVTQWRPVGAAVTARLPNENRSRLSLRCELLGQVDGAADHGDGSGQPIGRERIGDEATEVVPVP